MRSKKQPAEPHRVKSVEPIKLLSPKERGERIAAANYNIFKLEAADIYIDLLTDSGTSAMSVRQWAALMTGDESYAGAVSFRRFEEVVRKITGKRYVVPCHQGRSAENIVFSTLVQRGQYVLNNTHFDTTRANTLHKQGIPVDLPCQSARYSDLLPFKGNMDTEALERFIHEKGAHRVAMVIMTVTNNSVGGQPVSMANIRETAAICRRHQLKFFFDCARYAENAYFIKRNEPGYGDKSIPEIAEEMFLYCDGAMMSAKKDGLGNIGGFIVVDDENLYRQLTELLILVEGFPTYGGLAGRDLEALAVGLREALEYDYLDFRVRQTAYLAEMLKEAGVPIVEPPGGHAVFIDAGEFLPHIPPTHYPGQTLTVEFYREGGIRVVEIGSLMFGGADPNTGQKFAAARELVRLALPRRVYTNSHYDYVAEVATRIAKRKASLAGYRITREPTYLRHFTCDLAPIRPEEVEVES